MLEAGPDPGACYREVSAERLQSTKSQHHPYMSDPYTQDEGVESGEKMMVVGTY